MTLGTGRRPFWNEAGGLETLLRMPFEELGRTEVAEPCFRVLSGDPRQTGSMLLRERTTGSTSFKARTFVLAAQLSVYIENMVTAVSSLELRRLPELCVCELVEAIGETKSSGVAINKRQ